MENKKFKIIVSDENSKLMDERGIKLEDIELAINNAEDNDFKLYLENENLFLTRFRNNNYTIYVEYKLNDDECTINDAYGHRVSIVSDNK